ADGDLEWLLELSDSIVTYRARYQSQPEWLPVLDLLVLDKTNPRSIVFQVDGIQKTLQQLALSYESKKIDDLAPFQAELGALVPQMHLTAGNQHLLELFKRLMAASMHLSEQIGVQFFSHTA
ncbi:MAG: alpha-E domain-containing protein, partial [Burkholderiaceae bacterium]|nr:alpha-E domain-containing protein [Burkholderiaceae bacterium]